MIEIYLIDPKQISSVDMSTLYHSLTDEEQAKIKPLHENRRDEFIIGHGLLKSLLASKYNITSPLKYNEHGKPFVEGAHFNITHTKGLVLLAFGDCEIGIDVENLARQKDWQKIVDRYFHPMEQKFITDQDLFYQLWTKKESLLKCNGRGITVELNSFDVLEDSIEFDGQEYFFAQLPLPDGFTGHICMTKKQAFKIKGLKEVRS